MAKLLDSNIHLLIKYSGQDHVHISAAIQLAVDTV